MSHLKITLINQIGYFINLLENICDIRLFFIIKDKEKTKSLLQKLNYPTTITIGKHNIDIRDFIVCKPINGKCGKGIFFSDEYDEVPQKYLDNSNYFCERFEWGRHYRIHMYKNRIIAIIERIIPEITGDGKQTIQEIVLLENKKRSKKNNILLDVKDKNYIPYLGEVIKCNRLCNYSTGGKAKIIDLNNIPIKTKQLFLQLSKDLKLNIFSIDLIATDINLDIEQQKTFRINELEYLNDWDINFLLKDNFYKLAQFLIIKWLIIIIMFIIIIKIISYKNIFKTKPD